MNQGRGRSSVLRNKPGTERFKPQQGVSNAHTARGQRVNLWHWRGHAGAAQNKVLAIMAHTNFVEQAYRGTGSQKITEAGRETAAEIVKHCGTRAALRQKGLGGQGEQLCDRLWQFHGCRSGWLDMPIETPIAGNTCAANKGENT